MAEEALVVKEIFDLYKKGEGFQAIAKHLKKTVGDREWTKEMVKFIVTNPFYTGYLSSGRIRKGSSSDITEKENWLMSHCNGIPPLISQQEWDYCWHMYQKKRKGEIQPKLYKTRFLLKDILHCQKCQIPMSGKNQMTSGKDGKRYGAFIYFCKGCRLRCNADELHDSFLGDILASILLRSQAMNDSLHEEIEEGFTEEAESLRENILKLEAQIDKYAVDMDRLEKEIKGMYKKDADEETQRLVKMMFQYRAALNKKLDRARQLVEKYNKKIDYIENVEMDYEFWKEIFFETIRTEYHRGDTTLRRLLLYVFDRIELSPEGAIGYKARVDLTPREYIMYGSFAHE
ncbi:recombinase family protein [Brevibacillus sp. 179-C9.3 HS]|uniref:recombinase family protein n=1 Tax=unclassified Brevibacillus TaxID=2684853 RepID=UPI0039A2FBA3